MHDRCACLTALYAISQASQIVYFSVCVNLQFFFSKSDDTFGRERENRNYRERSIDEMVNIPVKMK